MKLRYLITGANGSIGRALAGALDGEDLILTDVEEYDVTGDSCPDIEPDIVFHLAAAKDAPEGEIDPSLVIEVNTLGTEKVLRDFPRAKMVLASTCKACDPETAYGASKLLAERMVLNAGGSVARFHNVVETRGNVFELWSGLNGPIPVTDCYRYFISKEQAVSTIIWVGKLPAGRYMSDPGESLWLPDVASSLYPDRGVVFIPRRRGDREIEPLHAACESLAMSRGPSWIWKVISPHDE